MQDKTAPSVTGQVAPRGNAQALKSVAPSTRRFRRWAVLATAAIVLALLLTGVVAAREALALRSDLQRAQGEFDGAVAVTEPVLDDIGSFRTTAGALEQAATHLHAADAALASAERHRARLAPLLAMAAHLPGWTQGLRDLSPMIAAAQNLARAGIDLSDGFTAMTARIDETSGTAEPAGMRLAAGLTAAEPSFNRALTALQAAQTQRQRVATDAFTGPLQPADHALRTFDDRYKQLHDNTQLVAGMPAAARSVLGIEGARTYAVLGQNSAELRPTGGFLGSLGFITLDGGAITRQSYSSVYSLEQPDRGYPPAPAPIARYLGGGEPGQVPWGLRDANWSPDFPTTARTIEEMLAHHQDIAVDGVLGFTSFAVGRLLDTLGPVEAEGFAEPITSASWYALSERLIYGDQPNVTIDADAEQNKGEVLGSVLQAIVARMQTTDVDQLPALLRTLQSLIDQRQLLVSFHDPAPATLAARYDADGRFRPPPTGDVLGVIDANVSYSKVDPYIDEQIEYDVWLNSNARPVSSRVTITYTNRLTTADALDPTRRIYGMELDPATGRFIRVPGLYGTYVRVYLPEKSRLLEVDPPSSAVLAGAELGFLTLEHYERVPAATQRRFSYTYQTPTDRRPPGDYQLHVLKQPGTDGHALIVRIHLPEDTEAATSLPMERSGDTLIYQGRLERPLDLNVSLATP